MREWLLGAVTATLGVVVGGAVMLGVLTAFDRDQKVTVSLDRPPGACEAFYHVTAFLSPDDGRGGLGAFTFAGSDAALLERATGIVRILDRCLDSWR